MRVDLNADIGESFGIYKTGNDELLMQSITSGSIACGFHAGDPSVMRATVQLAARAGVAVGAHPGFADMAGFGRREIAADAREIADLVLYQVGALGAMAKAAGTTLQHVKPHGALYHMSVERSDVAEAIAGAVAAFDDRLFVMGLPGSELLRAAARLGLRIAPEGFADRSYESDGSLTSRRFADAVLSDPDVVAERAVRMVRDRQVLARDGSVLSLEVDTICVHGDTPEAAAMAAAIRAWLGTRWCCRGGAGDRLGGKFDPMFMIRRRVIVPLVILALTAPSAAGALRQASSPRLSQNELIEQRVLPQMQFLFEKLVAEKRETTLDGVKVFGGRDRFLTGKIALGLSILLLHTPRSDPRFASYVAGFRDIADMTIDDPNDTWGIYYYASALNRLRKAGLLSEAVRPQTLEKLRQKLDWRPFVRVPEYTLIDLPTNYLGVAFSIARLRMLLGWEDESGARDLLNKITEHYQRYSGEFGFSDETDGAGRFDRYSVLLIGELAERLIESEMDATPQLKEWLRKSADLVLVSLNGRGDGFNYGRSIGPYADTAFLEVLAAAAYFDVLTPVEKDMAYAFATRAVGKYVDFWLDADMRSVNMWEKGRATDEYRNKSRILGENFSLADQLVKTNEVWNRIGYRNRQPSPAFDAWLTRLPRVTLTRFAKGDFERALVTYRAGEHVISIPLVSGGPQYHDKNTYFPIPYSHHLIQGSPNAAYPQLLPKFSLSDGSHLMPLVYMTGIELKGNTLTYRQEAFDRIEGPSPIKDERLKSVVRYELSPGTVRRVETYRPQTPLDADRVSLEFASFSEQPRVEGTRIRFGRGNVTELHVEGLQSCTAEAADASGIYRAAHEPMKTVVRCNSTKVRLDKPFTISWTLKYR